MEYYHTSINMTKAIYSKDHKYIVEQLKKARQETRFGSNRGGQTAREDTIPRF